MATKNFTEKDLLNEVISNETMSEQAKIKAQAMLDKINEKNEKRKTSEKAVAKAENDEKIKAVILDVLTDKPQASGYISKVVSEKLGEIITSNKVASVAKTIDGIKITPMRYDGRPTNGYSL